MIQTGNISTYLTNTKTNLLGVKRQITVNKTRASWKSSLDPVTGPNSLQLGQRVVFTVCLTYWVPSRQSILNSVPKIKQVVGEWLMSCLQDVGDLSTDGRGEGPKSVIKTTKFTGFISKLSCNFLDDVVLVKGRIPFSLQLYLVVQTFNYTTVINP